MVLALGAGWAQRDYVEYGYGFPDARTRLDHLATTLETVRDRLPRLNPPPKGDLPIMVGGGGEQVTLRLVAAHADWWNAFGPAEQYARKSRVLDERCRDIGRDPADVVRTALLQPHEIDDVEAFIDAGARHVIVSLPPPYDMEPVERVIAVAAAG
ncbi:MAG: LLM class flavin-dependent oxidoreductase [Actinomycetota bacterium]|nr:LLM class flavin-dependent oxidoreductase [Actinomycetota bacterium]